MAKETLKKGGCASCSKSEKPFICFNLPNNKSAFSIRIRSLKVKGEIVKDPNVSISLNYKEKMEKIKLIMGYWKLLRLGLLGKITVLKGLTASQLVYIFSPLQTHYTAIKEINVMFYHFLWNDKGDKIKRKVMINDYSGGGLKMIDIASFNRSLKATWIKRHL